MEFGDQFRQNALPASVTGVGGDLPNSSKNNNIYIKKKNAYFIYIRVLLKRRCAAAPKTVPPLRK